VISKLEQLLLAHIVATRADNYTWQIAAQNAREECFA
jgi:hypothetical protein